MKVFKYTLFFSLFMMGFMLSTLDAEAIQISSSTTHTCYNFNNPGPGGSCLGFTCSTCTQVRNDCSYETGSRSTCSTGSSTIAIQ